LKFDILTIFPNYFNSPLKEGLLGKAIAKGLIDVNIVNIREFTEDKHKTTDDIPYGGGGGMIMKGCCIFTTRCPFQSKDCKGLYIL